MEKYFTITATEEQYRELYKKLMLPENMPEKNWKRNRLFIWCHLGLIWQKDSWGCFEIIDFENPTSKLIVHLLQTVLKLQYLEFEKFLSNLKKGEEIE